MTESSKRFTITICMGSSCYSRGNCQNIEIIKQYLQEKKIEAEILITGELCINQCSHGPVISVGSKKFFDIEESNIHIILEAITDFFQCSTIPNNI